MKTVEDETSKYLGKFVMTIKDDDYSFEHLIRYLPRGCAIDFMGHPGKSHIYTKEQHVDIVRTRVYEYLKNRKAYEQD